MTCLYQQVISSKMIIDFSICLYFVTFPKDIFIVLFTCVLHLSYKFRPNYVISFIFRVKYFHFFFRRCFCLNGKRLVISAIYFVFIQHTKFSYLFFHKSLKFFNKIGISSASGTLSPLYILVIVFTFARITNTSDYSDDCLIPGFKWNI